MRPHITVITLGVSDLERSLNFYRDGLGLPTQGIVGTELEHGAVVFFDLPGGLKLALYPRSDIALDARLAVAPLSSTEFTIAHNVESKADVDAVMAEAERAGATVTDPPHGRFWGATLATSRTRMGTCGKLRGTRIRKRRHPRPGSAHRIDSWLLNNAHPAHSLWHIVTWHVRLPAGNQIDLHPARGEIAWRTAMKRVDHS